MRELLNNNLLSLLVFLPMVGLVVILFLKGSQTRAIRGVAFVTTAIEALLTFYLYLVFKPTGDEFQFVEKASWIPAFNIQYYLGVDGLSVLLLFLTGILSFLALFWAIPINKGVKGFHVLYLLLVTGMVGVFVSLDLFLFYVFWEVMLLPMYFLIGVWGGPRREYAAIKFFIYTLVGSVLILLVMLAFYFQTASGTGPGTFSIPELIRLQPFRSFAFPFQAMLFFALFIGFAIKVPVFPFHTWLPDAHVEAPTAISVILAGVLLKMGGYGFLRIMYPMLPGCAIAPTVQYFLATLGVINIVYGAFVAMAQTDFKKLVAYSSVSHMGYVLLGISVLKIEAMQGAVFQMWAHGLSSAMMFMLVGVVYERAHHRDLRKFGGLGLKMPVYFSLSIVGFFASLGLPGMVGFVGEVMTLLGSYRTYVGLTLIACLGIILTAGYILWTVQRVYMGKLSEEYSKFPDCKRWEFASLLPLALLCILFGVLPSLGLHVTEASSKRLIDRVTAAGQQEVVEQQASAVSYTTEEP